MQVHLSFIAIAALGALVQELIHWFDLRKKLDEQEQQKLLKSKHYWVITVIMIIVSGLGTWLLFYPFEINESDKTNEVSLFPKRVQFVLGAAFPLIFKKLVTRQQDLGANELRSKEPSFREVFNSYLS